MNARPQQKRKLAYGRLVQPVSVRGGALIPTEGFDALDHGLLGWLLQRWRNAAAHPRRLALLERIALGPRQSLALVEADGVHMLVVLSGEGTPVVYPLHPSKSPRTANAVPVRTGRISW